MVDTHKVLRVHLNNKLDWSSNTEALYRKGQSRPFFLRRHWSFNMDTRLLKMFYSVVDSVIFFAAACWGGGIRSDGANKLNKLVRKARSMAGMELDSVEVVTERRMINTKKTPIIAFTTTVFFHAVSLASLSCSQLNGWYT